MPGLRHGFVTRDGRLFPEWRKAGGTTDAIAWMQVSPEGPPTHDLYWVHASATEASRGYLIVLRALALRAPCIVLADVPDDLQALECLSLGARGYCNSHAHPRVLRLVTDVVMRGGLWVGESLLQRIVGGLARAPAPPEQSRAAADPAMERLSRREREVAEAVARGASNKAVANQLGITERTVKAHLSTIFDKLGVKDRLQLAVKIIGLGR